MYFLKNCCFEIILLVFFVILKTDNTEGNNIVDLEGIAKIYKSRGEDYICDIELNDRFCQKSGSESEQFNLIGIENGLKINQNSLSDAEIKIYNLLKSCKKQQYEEQFKNLHLSKMIGGWPELYVTNLTSSNINYDPFEVIGLLHRYKIPLLFNFTRTENDQNVLRFINGTNETIDREVYEQLILMELFIKVEQDFLLVEKLASEVFAFQRKFIEHLKKLNENGEQERYSLKDLQKLCLDIDWEKYLKMYFGENYSSRKLKEIQFELNLNQINNFKEIISFVKNYDKKVFGNYLMYQIFRRIPEIEKRCAFDNRLDPIVYRIYMERVFNDMDKNHILDVLNTIHSSLNSTDKLLSNTGISYGTERTKYLINQILNYNKTLNIQDLNKIYSDLNLLPDNFVQNILNLNEFQVTEINLKNSIYYHIRNFHESSAPIYFSYFGWLIWTEIINEEYPTTESLKDVINCYRNKSANAYAEYDDEAIRSHVIHDEAVQQTYNNFNQWLKQNKEIESNLNKMLSKYKFDIEKLFLLYLNNFKCKNNLILNSEIFVKKFDCERQPYMDCKIIHT